MISSHSTTSTLHSRPILVVDDNRDAVDMTAIMLRERGYSVAIAYSAFEAVDWLDRNTHIAMIISDIRMPEVDGFDFLRLVRKRFPTLPMVLMTGLPITAKDFIPRGASILQKPFTIEELQRMISRHLHADAP